MVFKLISRSKDGKASESTMAIETSKMVGGRKRNALRVILAEWLKFFLILSVRFKLNVQLAMLISWFEIHGVN